MVESDYEGLWGVNELKYNMRYLLFSILALFSLGSCVNPHPDEDFSETPEDTILKGSMNSSLLCFDGLDTTNVDHTTGCTAGIYKLINKKYVIYINPDFPVQFDSCYSVSIDTSNGKYLTQLIIFDNNDAHLTNFCTDVTITNFPKSTRELSAQSGNIILAFSNPVKLYGNDTYYMNVFIKDLIFIDINTGEKIEIKNELLWKVLNTGTPG